MLIKFTCNNHCGDFVKDELELLYQNQSFKYCPYCGEKLYITNLTDIVKQDLEIRVKNNVDKFFKEIGVDNTIDLIKRNKTYVCTRLYLDELKRRGFTIKE